MERIGRQLSRDAQIFHQVLKAIPARRSLKREIGHTAILTSGIELRVYLRCVIPESELPYGKDRRLLTWLWRRALRTRELNVSWKTLLDYLGPDATAVQQQSLLEATDRLGSMLSSFTTSDGVSTNLVFIDRQSFDRRGIYRAKDGAEIFEGGTWFELSIKFMELARRAEN